MNDKKTFKDEAIIKVNPKPARKVDSVGALLLITIGVILLLINFNLLPADFWQIIWRFWPLILILLGLQTIFGGNRLGDYAVFILGAGIIYLVLAWTINLPLPKFFKDLKDHLPLSLESPQPKNLKNTPFYFYQR